MLRVTQSISGEGATKYFDSALGRSDYYCSQQGIWFGKGAERLGLIGDVTRDDFVSLASNKVPGSEETLTVRIKDKRTAGYDFCFSVPKSVSVYLVHSKDRHLERMIHESFRETMTDVESRMEGRVRGKGDDGLERDENRLTGNLVAASFIHRETRPVDGIPDPHYHIHGYVFNATFDEAENRWKAGQFINLKADAPFYEAAFNARLAAKLIAEGYAIRRTDRSFELASVSRELIEKFSKRTQLIEALARAKYTILEARARALQKQTSMEFADAFAQVKSELGAETREKKSAATLGPEEQLANWREQMTKEELESLRPDVVKGIDSQNLVKAEDAKELAVQHLFERKSVARALHAAGMFLRRGLGVVTPAQAVEFTRNDSRFVQVNEKTELLTTRTVLAEEEQTIKIAKRGQDAYEALGRGEHWNIKDARVAADREQANAVHHVLGFRDLLTSIRGPAGSGKTTLMREAVGALESCSCKDVIVLAPSASAVQVLKDEGFAKSDTFQMFAADSLLQDVARGQILWVDEAGFLSARQMRWLLEYAKSNHTRVILSGDTRQHHSIERGDQLRVLQEHRAVRQAALGAIYRQQVAELRAAIEDLSRGKTLDGFDKLDAHGAIQEIEKTDERLARITEIHLKALKEGKSSLIVAPTHAECRAIAQTVRQQQKAEGLIALEDQAFTVARKLDLSESQKRDAINYHLHQTIEFHRNAKGGFKKGERWEIARLDPDGVVIVKDGQVRVLPLDQAPTFDIYRSEEIKLSAGDTVRFTKNFRTGTDRFRNNETATILAIEENRVRFSDGRTLKYSDPIHLDQGIAVTSHASQGRTVDQVIVSAPVASFTQVNQAQFYVSMSRARHAMHLFTDSKAALREAVTRKSERLSPLELQVFRGVPHHIKEATKEERRHEQQPVWDYEYNYDDEDDDEGEPISGQDQEREIEYELDR